MASDLKVESGCQILASKKSTSESEFSRFEIIEKKLKNIIRYEI